MNFFAELKRRHIYRVAAGYAVLAWVLLQLVNNIAPVLDLPPWVAQAFFLLLTVGFPVALFFAWMRELAPANGATAKAVTGKLDYVLIGALAVVIGKRRHIYRVAAAYAVTVCALVSLVGITSPAFASKKDDTIRFAFDQTLPSPDPYFNRQLIGSIVADAVWDTLIYRDPKTGEFKGELATAWKWHDDKTLDLDLRRGVKFHNGAAFDADDVVYTLNFAADARNKATNLGLAGQIGQVVKLDSYKVRIVFKRSFPAAIAYLSAPSSVIHPHDYYAKVGTKGMNAHPVGTGPYRVAEHALGKIIRLERNPVYFKDSPKPRPRITNVDIRFIPDTQTRVAEMVAGGLDLTTRVDPDQADQLRDLPSLRVVTGETNSYDYLALNTQSGTPSSPLRDLRVRQAIMHAIDRQTMVKFLVGEKSRVLHVECVPSDFACTDAGVPRYEYDPLKAKALLAQAGYAGGFDIDIYTYRNRNQTEAIINYLRVVGIRARLRFVQAVAMTSLSRAGKIALKHGSWCSCALNDVSATMSYLHDFSLSDMNRDPELHELLLRADSAMNPEVRKDSYAKAFTLVAERAYVLPLYSNTDYYLAAKELEFTPPGDGILRFSEMSWK